MICHIGLGKLSWCQVPYPTLRVSTLLFSQVRKEYYCYVRMSAERKRRGWLGFFTKTASI